MKKIKSFFAYTHFDEKIQMETVAGGIVKDKTGKKISFPMIFNTNSPETTIKTLEKEAESIEKMFKAKLNLVEFVRKE